MTNRCLGPCDHEGDKAAVRPTCLRAVDVRNGRRSRGRHFEHQDLAFHGWMKVATEGVPAWLIDGEA